MTDREIMQQALDALINGKRVRSGEGGTKYQPDLEDAAIAALESALAQPEQEPYCWVQSKLSQGMFYKEKPRRIHTIPLYFAPPNKEKTHEHTTKNP